MTETITRREFDSFREPPPSLAGRNLALVVVDLQYGSTHPDYGWVRFHRQRGEGATMEGYLQRLETTVFPNVRALLEAFRQAGERIVYLTIASELPDHSDRTPRDRRRAERWQAEGLPIPYAVAGTIEARVREEIAPGPDEPVVIKTTASGFNSSNLQTLLSNWGVDLLVFAGVATNYCVESTVRDAADLGYDCFLVEDACASANDASHQIGLASMEPFAHITTTGELIAGIASR